MSHILLENITMNLKTLLIFITLSLSIFSLSSNAGAKEIDPERASISKLAGTWIASNGVSLEIKGNKLTMYAPIDYTWANQGIILRCYVPYTFTKSGRYLHCKLISNGLQSEDLGPTKLSSRELRHYIEIMEALIYKPDKYLTISIDYISTNYLELEGEEYIREEYYEKLEREKELEKERESERKQKEAEEAQLQLQYWKDAQQINTIEGYETYKEMHPQGPYIEDANKAIKNLIMQQHYEKAINSEDKEIILAFINEYPSHPQIEKLTNRYNSLMGLLTLNTGRNESFSYFSKVTSQDDIPEVAKEAYNFYLEETHFDNLSPQSPSEDILYFINQFPNSPHIADVKNYMAEKMASQFTLSSSQQDYNKALSYASGPTYGYVNNKIKENNKKLKKYLREEDGGWASIILEYGNFIWNGRITDGLFEYNFGIKLKFGNYADRIQFAIGLKPGVGCWDFKNIYNYKDPDNDKRSKSKTFFTMPAEAEIRLNLFRTGRESWFYIDGRFDYNIVRKKKIQTPYSFYAGFGFGGKYADITFFYGRQLGSIDKKYELLNELPNPFMESKNNNFIGISFSGNIPIF